MLDELRAKIELLEKRVNNLEEQSSLKEIPNWARDAMDDAVDSGIITEPNNGSYDFYRILTILYRKGII